MKMLDLFSGIGGISLAADWAGIETVAFCEIEPFCQKVLNKHWPHVPIFEDVRKLNKDTMREKGVLQYGETIDIIAGGFPCQPFSAIGKQTGRNDDRDLWPEMFRIVRELKPTWVIGENVANFINMELERTVSDLESEGYETQTFILPACGVDAKHQRYRTFILAYSHSFEQRARDEFQQSKGNTTREFVSDSGSMECVGTMARTGKGTGRSGAKRAVWTIEPELDRMAYGVSGRVDRLKGLGNAVVPQQIYPIFEAIAKIEGLL